MTLTPTTDYRRAFRKGMRGTDVAALQINLDDIHALPVDGVFGPKTKRAVKDFQANRGLVEDGIAGLLTQQTMVIYYSDPTARDHNLPTGLLKSIASNESGFVVAAVSQHPSNGGLDIGPFQLSSGSGAGTQEFYRHAYSIKGSSVESATNIRHQYDSTTNKPVASRYLDDLAGDDVERFRWLMAILSHNWPAAAQNIPRYGLIYPSDLGKDDRDQGWIDQASGGRIHTPREWVASYVERATTFCQW